MATKTIKVCDRCKREIVFVGWTSKINGFRKWEINKIFNGNQDGYSYSDMTVELCADCTERLALFLRGSEGADDENNV